MSKLAVILLGAVIIGTALGVFLSNTFHLLPAGGLPLLCALVGLIASALLVKALDLVRKQGASDAAATAKPATDATPKAAKP